MKPFHKILCAVLAAIPPAAVSETVAVSQPNGQLAGTVDGKSFELPVHCEQTGDMLEAASHTGLFWTSNTSSVEPAVQVIRMNKMVGLTAYLDGVRYEFGSMGFEFDGFPLEYEGEIRSKKHGDYAARFKLDCADL